VKRSEACAATHPAPRGGVQFRIVVDYGVPNGFDQRLLERGAAVVTRTEEELTEHPF